MPHKRKGTDVYVFDFWRRGVRFCGTIGRVSKRAAETAERAEIKKAEQRLDRIAVQTTAPMTVSVAFDRFWLEVGTHYSGNYRDLVWNALAWLTDKLGGGGMIAEIDANKVTELVARRRGEGVKNATVNRTVTEILKRILRRASRQWGQTVQAIEWGELMLGEPRERVRELNPAEEETLFVGIPLDYVPIVLFLLVSGLRRNEAVKLRWPDVDFAGRTVTIWGKGGHRQTIPLSELMIAILTPLKGHHPVYVFTYAAQRARRATGRHGKVRVRGTRYPVTVSGLNTMWQRQGPKASKIEDFRLHDLRHTTATRLLRATGNLKLVQRLLRHSNIATTGKYAHVTDDDLRTAMDRVAAAHAPLRDVKKETG